MLFQKRFHPGLADWPLLAQRPPLCPELELWLLDPAVDLTRDHRTFPPGGLPFWAFCWASGQALARYLLDRPGLLRGKGVVDFGSGSGVAAIAAARAGAARVLAVEIDPTARAAILRNAERNGVSVETSDDAGPLARADVVLAADVCYEPGNLERLREHARSGQSILLADPGRGERWPVAHAPRASYPARTMPDVDEPTNGAAIFSLECSTSTSP